MATERRSEIGRQRAIAGLLGAMVLLALVFGIAFDVPVVETVTLYVSIVGLYLFWRLVVAIETIARKT